MAAWEFCLQDGGVSEGFTHKMAAWEFCLQDGGVSESLTHNMAATEDVIESLDQTDLETKTPGPNLQNILRFIIRLL